MRKIFIYLLLVSQLIFVNRVNAEADLLQIDMTQIPLNSKLKSDYSGYKYEITNKSNQAIDLVNAQIINGQDGAVAASAVDDGTGVGTMWAIMGPAGIFTFGIAWLVGLVATPVMLIAGKGRNKDARREGQAYSNLVNLGKLARGESTTVQTLIPIGAKPQLKITYQDPNSKELLMISR